MDNFVKTKLTEWNLTSLNDIFEGKTYIIAFCKNNNGEKLKIYLFLVFRKVSFSFKVLFLKIIKYEYVCLYVSFYLIFIHENYM